MQPSYDRYVDRLYEQQQAELMQQEQIYTHHFDSFEQRRQEEDSWEFNYFNELLSDNPLFWLAIGSGDYSNVDKIKAETCEKIVSELASDGFYLDKEH